MDATQTLQTWTVRCARRTCGCRQCARPRLQAARCALSMPPTSLGPATNGSSCVATRQVQIEPVLLCCHDGMEGLRQQRQPLDSCCHETHHASFTCG